MSFVASRSAASFCLSACSSKAYSTDMGICDLLFRRSDRMNRRVRSLSFVRKIQNVVKRHRRVGDSLSERHAGINATTCGILDTGESHLRLGTNSISKVQP